MFRELRRKKNAITDEAAKELLKESRRGILAVIGDEGYPYAVPVNYLYDEANLKIYFHGAEVDISMIQLKQMTRFALRFSVERPLGMKNGLLIYRV